MMMRLNSVRFQMVKNTQKGSNFGLVGSQGLSAAGGTVLADQGELKLEIEIGELTARNNG